MTDTLPHLVFNPFCPRNDLLALRRAAARGVRVSPERRADILSRLREQAENFGLTRSVRIATEQTIDSLVAAGWDA